MKRVVVAIAAVTACTMVGRAANQLSVDDANVQFQVATQLVQESRYLEAIDAFELATRTDDTALVTRARKGKVRAELRMARFDNARRDAELLSTGALDDPEAQTLYGDALWAKGLFDEADVQYRKALEESPQSSRAQFGLARSLTTRTRLDEALADAQEAVKSAPNDPEIHALLGSIYERSRRFDEAADEGEAVEQEGENGPRNGDAEGHALGRLGQRRRQAGIALAGDGGVGAAADDLALDEEGGQCEGEQQDRKSTRLNSSHVSESRMPSSA